MSPWQILGIAATREVREIKRAYAIALKKTHPEDDPEGFQKLRRAYETALAMAERGAAIPTPTPTIEPEIEPDIESDLDDETAADLAAEALAAEAEALATEYGTGQLDTPPPPGPAPAPAALPPVPPNEPGLWSAPSPLDAARALCEEILPLAERERPRSIVAIMRRPGWEQLDFQSGLHDQIVSLIEQQFDRYADIVPAIAAHYGWEQQRRRIGHVHPAIDRIGGRLEARRWRKGAEDSTNKAYREAFELLRKPPDEAAFRKFARWSRELKTMRQMLAELNTTHRAALFFEVDRNSVAWWQERLDSVPTTWDRQLAFAGWSLIVSFLSFATLRDNIPASSPALRALAWLEFPAIYGVLAGGEWLFRAWRRALIHGGLSRLRDLRIRWHDDPRRRRALVALAGVAAALDLCAVFDARLGWATLIGAGLMIFWYGLVTAASTLLFLALPLAVAIGVAVDTIYSISPALQHVLPVAPRPLFSYLLGALLFIPLARLWSWTMSRTLKSNPEEPLKAAFFVSVVLLFASIVCNVLYGKVHDPAVQSGPARMQAAIKRSPRPLSDVVAMQSTMSERLDAVSHHFHSAKKPPKGARIEVQYVVARTGKVESADIFSSTFDDPGFDAAIAETVKAFTFAPNDRYALTPFLLAYQAPDPAPGYTLTNQKTILLAPPPASTPALPNEYVVEPPHAATLLRPLAAVREAKIDQAALDRLYRKFHPAADAPSSAKLEVSFMIQPDGRVTDAKVRTSDFHNDGFETAFAATVEKWRFPAEPRYRPTPFTWTFTGVDANTGRPPRPLGDIVTASPERDQQLGQVYDRFYRGTGTTPPEGAQIVMVYTVERDGSVSGVKVRKSTFQNPDYDSAMVEAVKAFRFPPGSGYAATPFTLTYGAREKPKETPPPATGQPGSPSIQN